MKKILKFSIATLALSGILFAADYSKVSNDELIKMSGSVQPKDMLDYKIEVGKRVDEMTMKDANEFKNKIREQEKQVYDNMKVKDFKARQKAIMEAMKEQCKNDKPKCAKMDRFQNKHNEHFKKFDCDGNKPKK
ncbi:MAG: DUF1104 domain-containing protein [Helicobacteraceae bacterium]|nr:DUF1104 domain-containing protein [Helicobacteraceae bacterium]